MKLTELKMILRSHPAALPLFLLPDGDRIPAHFHITEVGHVTKRFIDCGGTLHDKTDTCLLQTWVSDADPDHRLNAGTFAKILDLGAQVLPHDDLDVEVEYDCCVVAQYPVASALVNDDVIEFQLGEKQTDCLAREKCGVDGEGCCNSAETEKSQTASCC
jgi:uncharacterized protein DUF6428